MTAQSAAAMDRTKEAEATGRGSKEIFSQSFEMYGLIARRAFELFEIRGAEPGHDKEDWLRAETELLHPVRVNLIESIREYVVQGEVPGFRRKDLEIGVEQRRLVISGVRDDGLQRTKGQVLCCEVAANRILRTVDLPSDIDPSRVSASVEDGILTVVLPKALDAD